MFTLHSRTTFAHFPAVTNTPASLLSFLHTLVVSFSHFFGCAFPSAFFPHFIVHSSLFLLNFIQHSSIAKNSFFSFFKANSFSISKTYSLISSLISLTIFSLLSSLFIHFSVFLLFILVLVESLFSPIPLATDTKTIGCRTFIAHSSIPHYQPLHFPSVFSFPSSLIFI